MKVAARPVQKSPLPLQPWSGFDIPMQPGRALVLNKDMFKSCDLVWRQPEKSQTVQVVSEGPIRVSAECVVLTDAPVGCCGGLKKEHLHRPVCYICWVARPPASVKCANRGRQICSQHVSSPRKSITFHKEMLTIKRVH